MTAPNSPPADGFEPFTPGATPSGLVVLRASRLEAMVPELYRLMGAMPPDHVLAPHTVIAAHPGMRQWLLSALAREAGTAGIVANVDLPLASAWIEAEARRLLGQQAIQLPTYQPDHLRWRILDVLEDPARAGLSDARLARYLAPVAEDQAPDLALRKFQLADRLARIFSQYMVYRPQWLQAWQDGNFNFAARNVSPTWQHTEQDVLAPLWHTLRRDAGPHRGEVIRALIHALAEDTAPPAHPLHVFGVSHLAPNELAALKAAALRRVVVFHVPDPCREYWAGLRRRSVPELHQALAMERVAAEADDDSLWQTTMHPMLSQWGRMGRDFLLQLADENDRILVDVRHNQDDAGIEPRNRLERVQESVRQDAIALLASEDDRQDDASLRIHVCHTRVRELEAVRDAILDAIDRHKDTATPLLPSEIAVVAPDIGRYAPLIPGVFGAEADRSVWPPYAISDNSTRAAHPLFAAFGGWLAVPGTRITANQLINLLAQPAIARAYRLDAGAVAQISRWLAGARATWGLDAAHRARFGVPAGSEQNSLAWALDRLIAGFVFGNAPADDATAVFNLPAGALAPAEDIHGPEADALGGLSALLADLRHLDTLATTTDTAAGWSQTLAALLESSFRTDPADADEQAAMVQLRTLVQSLAEQSEAAGTTPLLHFEVVRQVLGAALDSAPAKGRFLRGGITFAGMVPQRAVPFRFIAVLGLNEGEFPRHGRDAGLDLMSQVHAVGDRDVRNDDRWLFLETLMSARMQLHLSYIGQSAAKGEPLNPATPLAELDGWLLQAWRAHHAETETDPVTGKESKRIPPWRVLHALQPFAKRYFDGRDVRLFSFDDTFAGITGTPEAAEIAPWVRVLPSPDAPAGAPEVQPLQDLLAYYRDPAKFIFRTHLNAKLDSLTQDKLAEHEPLAAAFERFDTVGRATFFETVVPARAVPDAPPAWLQANGLLPLGDAGTDAWAVLRSGLVDGWAQAAPFVSQDMRPCDVAVDLLLDADHPLQGQVRHVWSDDAGTWVLLRFKEGDKKGLPDANAFNFKDTVPLFIEWAALRLSLPDTDTLTCVFPHRLKEGFLLLDQLNAWQARFAQADADERILMKADLQRRLLQLAAWVHEAAFAPLAYFPKTSHAVLSKEEIGAVWSGTDRSLGESGYSVYARLIGRGQDFTKGDAAHVALTARAKALQALIHLEPLP